MPHLNILKSVKKNILFVFLLSFLVSFSQSENFNYLNDSNASPKNKLSLYLKKEVPKKLLKKVKFHPKKNNIILFFNINKENKPYKIFITNFSGSELQKSIKEAFKKYPLEELNLASLDKKNRYSLQIISKKGRKNIFNCSDKISIETPPICENCNDLEFYEDLKNCLNLEVTKYFYQNADFSKLNNLEATQKTDATKGEKNIELYLFGEVDLFIQFAVSKEGKLINKKTKVPTVFKKEAQKILSSFPILKKAGTFNGKKSQSIYSFKIPFKKGEKPVYKKSELLSIEYTNPTSENELANYYSKKLTTEFIEKANLNRINNQLILFFELDKKGKPFNLKTNSRSSSLDKKIISIFKKYPIEKLNIPNKSPFKSYFAQILSFENNQILIKASTTIGSIKAPIFPGCENAENLTAAKKCFSKGVQMHFMKKFDADLPKRLGLSRGRKRIFISFKINKTGNVTKIKVKAPHKIIKEEIINVMKQLPKVTPAAQGDKKATIKYSIPFTLIVN